MYYSRDPSTNVVLLEDFAAVLGLTIAATCISITHYTGNPLPDAVGSLLIGTLLGGVASFIIYTNTMSLVGRSVIFLPLPYDSASGLLQCLLNVVKDIKTCDLSGNVFFCNSYDKSKHELLMHSTLCCQCVTIGPFLVAYQNLTRRGC